MAKAHKHANPRPAAPPTPPAADSVEPAAVTAAAVTPPAGPVLFRCHVQGQPDGVFAGADKAEAIVNYCRAYGITGSDHPFNAEPLTTGE